MHFLSKIQALTLTFLSATPVTSAAIIRQLGHLEPGTFLENIATRSNGQVLATEFLRPRLWSFDTTAKNSNLTLLHEFTGYKSLTGITEVSSDVYVVVATNASMDQNGVHFSPNSSDLWKIDYRGCERPSIIPLAHLALTDLPNGITYVPSASTILVADSQNAVVVAVDLSNSASRIAIDDPAMKPCADGPIPVGINGVRYHEQDSSVYWTNSACGTLNKIFIDSNINPGGPSIIVANTGQLLDDFAIAADGTAYLADPGQNNILRAGLDGVVDVVAGQTNSTELAGPSSVQFGKTRRDRAKGTIYVTTNGGLSNPAGGVVGAQLVAIDLYV